MQQKSIISFNLLFIDSSALTGPGYYALELSKHIAPMINRNGFKLEIHIKESAWHHLPDAVQTFVVAHKLPENRAIRVLYEQLMFPIFSKIRGTSLLFSPAFVSPLWGARKIVVTICDMYYKVVPGMTEKFQQKYWEFFVPLSAHCADRVITISDNTATDVKKYIQGVESKTNAIPLASRFSPMQVESIDWELPERFFVLIVANLTPNKNCAIVVEAIAMMHRAGRDINLVHVGKDHLGLLAGVVQKLDAQPFVTTLGKVDDDELVSLYRKAGAVVVASLYEGFGMPAVEAQALGAPLVCSDRGALPEAAGDAALYFDPTNAVELAQRIEQVMAMSCDERRAMIVRGLESANRFSWDRTARETLAIFRDLLEEA
jgi:glycosyltransferase involved in cell wall biosynthesis